MIQRFKIGDNVILKKGTQKMIIAIDHLGVDMNGERFFNGTYRCIWTDDDGQRKTKVCTENDLMVEGAKRFATVSR